jgi:hypothetical protein
VRPKSSSLHTADDIEVGREIGTAADNEQIQACVLPCAEVAVVASPFRLARREIPEERPALAMASASASDAADMPSDLHLVSGHAIQEVDNMVVHTVVADTQAHPSLCLGQSSLSRLSCFLKCACSDLPLSLFRERDRCSRFSTGVTYTVCAGFER